MMKQALTYSLKVWLTSAVVSGIVATLLMFVIRGIGNYAAGYLWFLSSSIYFSLKFTLLPCLVLLYQVVQLSKTKISVSRIKFSLTIASIVSTSLLMVLGFLLDAGDLGLDLSTLFIWLFNTLGIILSVWIYNLSLSNKQDLPAVDNGMKQILKYSLKVCMTTAIASPLLSSVLIDTLNLSSNFSKELVIDTVTIIVGGLPFSLLLYLIMVASIWYCNKNKMTVSIIKVISSIVSTVYLIVLFWIAIGSSINFKRPGEIIIITCYPAIIVVSIWFYNLKLADNKQVTRFQQNN